MQDQDIVYQVALSLRPVVWVILSVMLCALLIIIISEVKLRINRSTHLNPLRFRWRFGIWPEKGDSYSYRHDPAFPIKQKIVDNVLSHLARNFLDACEEEQQIVAKSRKEEANWGAREDLKKYRRAQGKTEKHKTKFWQACDLAAFFDYSVREKAILYIESGVIRAKFAGISEGQPLKGLIPTED